jgi:hypothetical protein
MIPMATTMPPATDPYIVQHELHQGRQQAKHTSMRPFWPHSRCFSRF